MLMRTVQELVRGYNRTLFDILHAPTIIKSRFTGVIDNHIVITGYIPYHHPIPI